MKGQDCAEDSQEEENKIYKPRKPPDADHHQRKHKMEMEEMNNLIREKEAIYKSLSPTRSEKPAQSMGNREENLSKLRSLKSEKDKRLKRKQVIDAELRDLSQQLQKKTETCTKLQASVRYKDEQKTNDAIKQLEKHLSTHQLKLLEEKKLVSEIDALKRSKKTLSEYLSVKRDVDHLRQMQGSLRHERDILIRETHEIRANENGIKTFLDKQKTESKDGEGNDEPTYDKDTLKKEIDSLYETRRELHGFYKQKMAFFRDEQKKMEKNNIKRKAVEKQEEVRISKIAPERRRQETRPEIQPFEEEKRVCANLLQFLESQRFTCSQPLSEQVEGKVAIPNRFFEGPKSEFKSGSFVMKKSNDDLDGLFATSSHKISRKGSKKGRKSKDLSQKLGLHPHVLEQFVRLNLHPPSTLADVAKVLEQLKEKMDMYEKATIKVKPPLSIPEMSVTTSEKQSHTLEIIADKVHANIAETERKMRDSGGQDTDGTRDSSNVAAELGAGSESGIPETLVIERGTYCEIKDNDGKDGDAVPSSLTQTSEAFSAATEIPGVKTVDVGSLGISKTSEISTTHEDMHGIYCEQSGKNIFFSKIEPNILQDEKQILEVDEEKNTEYKEILQEDELIKNKANSDGIISKKTKSVDCPYDVIAETIEKNLESFGMNESSKEIQVKVT